MQIAIIEDNQLVRDSLVTVLRLRDLTGVGFASAEEFQTAADRGSFAALLVDYRLPGQNGLQLLSQLRASGSAVPAILMSGNFDCDVREAADKLDGVHTLRKPCHPKVLLETLQDLLTDQRAMD